MKIGNNVSIQIDDDKCFGGISMISALKKASKVLYPKRSVEDLDFTPQADEQPDPEYDTIDGVIRESSLLSSHSADLDFLDESSGFYVAGYVLRRLNVQKNFCSTCLEFLVSSREEAVIIMPRESQWTQALDIGGLKYPTHEFCQLIMQLGKVSVRIDRVLF